MKRALLTVGNTLRGDDGVGYALGERLRGKSGWEIFHGEDCPENQINLIRKFAPDLIVVVDAVFGLEEGDVQFIDVSDEEIKMFMTHSIPVQYLMKFLGDFCDSVLFLGIGVDQKKVLSVNPEISEAAQASIDSAENLILQFNEMICKTQSRVSDSIFTLHISTEVVMNNNVLVLFKDVATSLKFKKILNFLDYINVEILSCDDTDFDDPILFSQKIVIMGTSITDGEKLFSFIQKAILLELPVVFFTPNAEYYLRDMKIEKISRSSISGLKPTHEHIIDKILQESYITGKDRNVDYTSLDPEGTTGNSQTLLRELRCLFFISDIMKFPDLKIDAVMKYICDSIEKAICYDGKGQARIRYLGNVYQSEDFHESMLRICSPIYSGDNEVGEIEVFLNQDYYRNTNDLLKMENDLINAISEQIGNFISSREAVEKLEKTNEELRRLSSYLQTVRENERKAVAHTIHDEFGQKLITLRYGILSFKKTISEKGIDVDAEIDEMLSLLDSSMESLRNVTSNLRPGVLDKFGIAAAIEWLAQDTEKKTGLNIHVNCSPDGLVLNEDYTTTLFRIFQEATTNILRHANATEVLVNLKKTKDEVFLIVLDNGKGISEEDINKTDSFGIKGIRERVLSFQGTFSIMNNYDSGTILKISLPLYKDKFIS